MEGCSLRPHRPRRTLCISNRDRLTVSGHAPRGQHRLGEMMMADRQGKVRRSSGLLSRMVMSKILPCRRSIRSENSWTMPDSSAVMCVSLPSTQSRRSPGTANDACRSRAHPVMAPHRLFIEQPRRFAHGCSEPQLLVAEYSEGSGARNKDAMVACSPGHHITGPGSTHPSTWHYVLATLSMRP
jgi:hypothetical protein